MNSETCNTTRRSLIKRTSMAALACAVTSRLPLAFATPVKTLNNIECSSIKSRITDKVGESGKCEVSINIVANETVKKGKHVSVSVAVRNPLQQSNYVKSVIILADENQEPVAALSRFKPDSFLPGHSHVGLSARIRLEKSQKVVAVARMNDGSLVAKSKTVKVV